MKTLDHRTLAHLDMVLDDVCRSLPHGGDHATRKKVAQKLLSIARKGNVSIDALAPVARDALLDATKPERDQRELTARRG
jgi:hypothetical protein